jgi:DNA adenine methylase
LNLLRLEEQLSAAHLRLSQVYIENQNWRECVERYDRAHTLFYMDPPYWETEGYGMPFPLDQYTAIAEAMQTMKGRAVVSLNDHPEIRRAFNGFSTEGLDITYTVGGNAGGIDRSADRRELVIFSWDRHPGEGGLF